MGKIKIIYLCEREDQACQFVDEMCTAFFSVKRENKKIFRKLDAPKGRELGKFSIVDKSGNKVQIVGRGINKNLYHPDEKEKIQQMLLSRKVKLFKILKEFGLTADDFFNEFLIIYDFPMTASMRMILTKVLRDYCSAHAHTKPYLMVDNNEIRNTMLCKGPLQKVILRYSLKQKNIDEAEHDFKDPALKCFVKSTERARALGTILYAAAALLATKPKRKNKKQS